MDKKQQVEELERHLLTPEVRNSETQLDNFLADDFVEFGSSGRIWGKKEIIASVIEEQGGPAFTLEAFDFTTKNMADDTIFLTYRCVRKNMEGCKVRVTNRSLIWRLADDKWRIFFHQGTVVQHS